MARMDAESPRELLVDRAYATLKEQVLDCVLAPGQFVSERGIAAEHGFGIAATRAALMRLSSEGLMAAVPRVGYQVAPITLRGVVAFFEAWAVIGPEFVKLAMQRMRPEHREAIDALNRDPLDRSPEQRIHEADELWRILADAADNAVFSEIMERLNRDMHRIFLLSHRHALPTDGLMTKGISLNSDPETARKDAALYIDAARRHVLAWLTETPSIADVQLTFD